MKGVTLILSWVLGMVKKTSYILGEIVRKIPKKKKNSTCIVVLEWQKCENLFIVSKG